MDIEVLISTMNLKNKKEFINLLKKMNISNKALVINQIDDSIEMEEELNFEHKRLLSFKEKGLSKSRNKAILYSDSDICLLADDDLVYENNFELIVKEAYEKYPHADIIVFYVESNNDFYHKSRLKKGKICFLNSLKVQSVQISFKRNSIINNNIRFDENFGAGCYNYMGEENIFLADCLRKKLKIYSYPIKIANLTESDSSWFDEYNKKYFEVKGKCFKRIDKHLALLLCIQFVLRKYKIYKNNICFKEALKSIIYGMKKGD